MATFLAPEAAGAVLLQKLEHPERPLTIADAAALSGLALRDAETGLHYLSREYRGRMRVSEKGDLLFYFPTGFSKFTEDTAGRLLRSVGRGLLGIARFVVRAWITIVLVFYGLMFVALAIALAARSNDERGGGLGGAVFGGLLRLIADALFWTFHPFSPFYVSATPVFSEAEEQRRLRARLAGYDMPAIPEEPKIPFYEKVNRFLFGPMSAPVDANEMKQRIVREVRVRRGRIGLSDVMRVTGLPRADVDPLMSELMLDFDGTVDVSEGGGIYYTFTAIRRTARDDASTEREAVPAAWEKPKTVPPLTGNPIGSNILIAFLNAFNLLMSAFVMAKGYTLHNLFLLLTAKRGHPPVLVQDGLPLVLGLIPFLFSVALFVLPAVRALLRPSTVKGIVRENGRLAILKTILESLRAKKAVTHIDLANAYRASTGERLDDKTLALRVAELGGDVELEATRADGRVHYRFAELELEREALEEERERASDEEERPGKVIFNA